jgi:phage terminase large subunit-like protein
MTKPTYNASEKERAIILACRDSFRVFVAIMHREIFPAIPWQETELHLKIFAFLDRAMHEEGFRGCINIPPRAGKTHLICMWIAWCFGHFPDSNFIYASSTADLAETSSNNVRRIMDTPLYQKIFATRRNDKVNAKDKFATTENGGMLARGVDGQITGFGAGITQTEKYRFGGCLIADDLHKLIEARSPAAKGGVKQFVSETFDNRVNDPRTPKIFVGQRVAPDDIFALLMPPEGSDQLPLTGEFYEQLKITPLDEDGVSIWELKWPTKWCHMKAKAGPWEWSTQYLQEPYNLSGTVFQVDMMPIIHTRPDGAWRAVRFWDLAARVKKPGRTEPDFTASCKLVYYPKSRMYVIEDGEEFRAPPHIVRSKMLTTGHRDGREVKIGFKQDPGQAGIDQVQSLTEHLSAFRLCNPRPHSGDKVTAAEPCSNQLNVGLVGVLAGLETFVKDRLRPFPDATHDDFVDALSGAYAELAIPNEDELARLKAMEAYNRLAGFDFGPGGERKAIDGAVNDVYAAGYQQGEEPI